jgi:hypothetical protein
MLRFRFKRKTRKIRPFFFDEKIFSAIFEKSSFDNFTKFYEVSKKMLKNNSGRVFFLNKPNAAPPNFSHKIFTDFPQVKKGIFSGRVHYVDSEYMLDVANGSILAEHFQKVENQAK